MAGTALRLLLPVCLLVATGVALSGLWRVLERTTPATSAEPGTSLELGGPNTAPGGADPVVPSAPVQQPAAEPTAPAPTPVRVTSAVAVVNASRVAGLARRTADALRARGITVASVGNFTAADRPAQRTVYYPPGGVAQARELARMAGGASVAPAPRWVAAGDRLVLVVLGPA